MLPTHSNCSLRGAKSVQTGLRPVDCRPCVRPVKVPLPSKRNSLVAHSMLPGAENAVDVATTTAASQLILNAASSVGQQLPFHFDAFSVADFLQTLQNSLHGIGSSIDNSHLSSLADSAIAQSGITEAAQHFDLSAAADAVQNVAASLPTMDATAALHDAANAVIPTLVDISNTPVATLAMWAADKLAVVQSIDPAAFDVMRGSLEELVSAFTAALDQQAGSQAQAWTSALVLGVQQLVTTLHSDGGGASIDTMLAAQDAIQASIQGTANSIGLDGVIKVTLGVIALIIASVPREDAAKQRSAGGASSSDHPEEAVPSRYDPQELTEYFSRHPTTVLRRNMLVGARLSKFAVSILLDWKLGNWDKMMPQRAKELRVVIEELGPAYIKIAQALSTRVDMVPEPYIHEFCKLQDNVPPFSTVEARHVLEQGLGQPVDAVFDWLSEEPLAAASLGQVYRGKLREEYGGGEVAVKVQRPMVLESVALDIFIMRRAMVIFSKLPGMSDQWAGVLDDWALRFFMEMDYQLEAYNTMTFKKQMASLEGVRVATVYPELTSRKVIVTEWIDGERLAESKSEDVKALCGTLLNCYLIQLLETGLLHADPHPGNLMRTADGKIVILDFGLVSEVTEDQRVTLVEYIAHLTMQDWQGVSRDLVALGFMPEGVPDHAIEQIAPIMEKVMGVLVNGGGIRGGMVSIAGIVGSLDSVARDFKMCVPPYFALVLRAFSVIEGIALKVDENYAIVQECMPYLSRRLLTDNNPRMRAALKQLLYGNSSRLDIDRLQKMINAFSAFTTGANQGSKYSGPSFSAAYAEEHVKGRAPSRDDRHAPIISDAMKEALKVVFAKNGSYAQELIVEEAVAAIDAMSREALGEALRLVLSSATAVAALRSMEALGPLRTMLLPLPLPMEMLSSMEPAVALTSEDRQALNTIRTLLDLLQPSLARMPSMAATGGRALRAASELMPLMPELLPGVQVTMELFFRQLIRRMALRLAEDLEPGKAAAAHQAKRGGPIKPPPPASAF